MTLYAKYTITIVETANADVRATTIPLTVAASELGKILEFWYNSISRDFTVSLTVIEFIEQADDADDLI